MMRVKTILFGVTNDSNSMREMKNANQEYRKIVASRQKHRPSQSTVLLPEKPLTCSTQGRQWTTVRGKMQLPLLQGQHIAAVGHIEYVATGEKYKKLYSTFVKLSFLFLFF